ncbi:response regulator [soil metagenome]
MTHTIKKILLIDDDPEDVDILEMALKEASPETDLMQVWDGNVLTMLITTEYLPDLILMDLNMPLKSGKECLIELKSSARYSKIPIVILSTTDDQIDIDYCKANGAVNFFRKPTSFSGTVKLVTDLCNGIY